MMRDSSNRAQIEKWNSGHAIVMIVASASALFLVNLKCLILVAFFSFAFFIFQNRTTLQSLKPFGGYAGWISTFRLILLGILFMFEFKYSLFVSGLTIVVCLDVIDGWIARKYEQSSLFGQYYDMEIDAFYVLLMCIWFYLFGGIDLWILVPGMLRYFYKLGIDILPKSNFKEEKKSYASTIAGIFFICLLVSLVLENPFREIVLAIGSLLIVFSFSMSAIEYIRFYNERRIRT